MKDSFGSKKDIRKKLVWALLFIVIAALSAYAVASASKDFSITQLRQMLRGANPFYVIAAFATSCGYVVLHAVAIKILVQSFGQSCGLWNSICYCAADVYFSAITPSSTGGQPASAYMMIRDGISGSCTTISLMLNVALYSLSKVLIGIAVVVIDPGSYLLFGTVARWLIVVGSVTILALAAVFLLLAVKRSIIERIARIVIGIGCRFRILKDRKSWNDKLDAWMEDYEKYAGSAREHKPAMVRALIFIILQRLCYFSITMFMYIAVNINKFPGSELMIIKNGARLLGAQSLIGLGSTYIPIPGAMGYTDLMMYDSFSTLMSSSEAASLAILARTVSFYFSVIVCFVITIWKLLDQRKRLS